MEEGYENNVQIWNKKIDKCRDLMERKKEGVCNEKETKWI